MASDPGASNFPANRDSNPYLWAIFSGYSGSCFSRSNMLLSGLAETKREVVRIAEQYGLEPDFRIRSENNNDFVESIRRSKDPIISYIKRQSGKFTLAVWNNWIDYLIGMPPLVFEDHDSDKSLNAAIHLYGNGMHDYKFFGASINYWSEYITHHIRREEAKRKFITTPSGTTSAANIEFVYVNYREWSCRADWKRHRVIKRTERHIFVDRYPFCGKGYLRSGWRSMVIYATMLDRESIENEQCFYHKTLHHTFYTEKQAKRRCRRLFIKGGAFTEQVVELPRDDLAWALMLLNIAEWPTTEKDIKMAYARAAMNRHPDRGGSHQGFIDCTNAKNFLIDMCDH